MRTLEGAITMSDLDETLDEGQESAVLDPNIRKQLREAEKARKELEATRAELTQQKREIEFAKAGIPENGLGSLFRKAYDGEATAEAIKQAATEYGILQAAPTPEAQAPAFDGELEALRRSQGATIGTSGVGPDLGQEYLARLAEASNPEEVMKIVSTPEYQNALNLWSARDAR
jgi:hypothetical protein